MDWYYPVTALLVQRFLGANNWPWNLVKKFIITSIEFRQQRHPKVIAISSHDNCDWTIERIRQTFFEAYQDVLVGKEIVVLGASIVQGLGERDGESITT